MSKNIQWWEETQNDSWIVNKGAGYSRKMRKAYVKQVRGKVKKQQSVLDKGRETLQQKKDGACIKDNNKKLLIKHIKKEGLNKERIPISELKSG